MQSIAGTNLEELLQICIRQPNHIVGLLGNAARLTPMSAIPDCDTDTTLCFNPYLRTRHDLPVI